MRSRIGRRERRLRLDPDRLGVADDDRHAHARRAHGQLGELEDLACLLAELDLLVVLEAVELPVHAQLMVVGVLRAELGDRVGAGARHRLVGRDPHALAARRRRAAVRAPSSAESCSSSGSRRSRCARALARRSPRARRAGYPPRAGTPPTCPRRAHRLRPRAERARGSTCVPIEKKQTSRSPALERRGRRLLDLEVPEPPAGGTRTTRTCGCSCIRDRPGTGASPARPRRSRRRRRYGGRGRSSAQCTKAMRKSPKKH